jgi:hypothetical protein
MYDYLRFQKLYLPDPGGGNRARMLIFTRPDLSSFVYDSATNFKISNTGFLDNSAVPLTIATFCAGRLDS